MMRINDRPALFRRLCPTLLLCLATSLLAGQPASLNIKAFGAVNDGKTLNTGAIQRAIDSCTAKGGGTVVIPAGKFLTGTVFLKSNVMLHLEKDAVLLGSTSRPDYAKSRWYALVLAEKQHDIGITGPGTIDGQGRDLAKDVIRRWRAGEYEGERPWDESRKEENRPSERNRPFILNFQQCKGIRMEGFTIRDAACWVQIYDKCENLLIDHITVESMSYWNNDGIDIVDCRHATVRNCYINAADDGICLKSHDAAWICEDIRIEHCKIRSSASALKFGTASQGGFRHVRVRDLTIWDTFRSAIALESVDGGVLEDIEIRDVTAKNTGNPIFIRLGKRNKKRPPGVVQNILIKNIRVEVPRAKPDAGYETEGPPAREPQNIGPSVIAGLPGYPVRNVRLENIEISYPGGADTSIAHIGTHQLENVPENPENYPEFSMFGELPAYGFYVRHAAGISFKNCRFGLVEKDYRPAVVLDDVEGLSVKKLTLPLRMDGGDLIQRKVSHLRLNGIRRQ
jgi:hypothetical protein